MQENDSPVGNQNDGFTNTSSSDNEYSKWVDNKGDEVKLKDGDILEIVSIVGGG